MARSLAPLTDRKDAAARTAFAGIVAATTDEQAFHCWCDAALSAEDVSRQPITTSRRKRPFSIPEIRATILDLAPLFEPPQNSSARSIQLHRSVALHVVVSAVSPDMPRRKLARRALDFADLIAETAATSRASKRAGCSTSWTRKSPI